MNGNVLMVQGCASSVGKSLIVAGLCRVFRRRGLSVAPFKAQNLALNSYVTADGHEIGRAQAVQAEAAGIEATVEMNPLLLKPESDAGFQAVVMGKPFSKAEARELFKDRSRLSALVLDSLERLRAKHDLVLIEGAGSPAEVNLRERDIANMHIARKANAPVLLVGDIDRGGVFAHLVGTLALLAPEERALVAGMLINKFRGDRRLLDPGILELERITNLPVFGVLPYIPDLRIAEEDSAGLDERQSPPPTSPTKLDIAVVRFPFISNFDDFLPLEREPDVVLRYVDSASEIESADLVILPGTKNTRGDLDWLRENGLAEGISKRAERGLLTLGICGGYQMLGQTIEDPLGIEGEPGIGNGLGLLPVKTRFRESKTSAQVSFRPVSNSSSWLTDGLESSSIVRGYELHMGELLLEPDADALFVGEHSGEHEGAHCGSVAGTLLHGLFENLEVRRGLLNGLRQRQQVRAPSQPTTSEPLSLGGELDRVREMLEANLDIDRIESLISH